MAEENIWIDKLKLSEVVLKKESDLIEVYANLIKLINRRTIKIDNIGSWNDYHGSWVLLYELYSFLRFNKIQDIKKRKKKDETLLNDINELETIMVNYENTKISVDFSDLQKSYNIILNLISLSGYHDDTFAKEEIDDEPQFW